jgi:hypothetical protein
MLLAIQFIKRLILNVLDSRRQLVSQQCRRCNHYFGVPMRVFGDN